MNTYIKIIEISCIAPYSLPHSILSFCIFCLQCNPVLSIYIYFSFMELRLDFVT